MMPELLAHLVGDYALQNHAMATRKTSSSRWAALHVACYMLPFLCLTRSPAALAIIAGTHFLIDRFRLAGYWVRFWGIGVEGRLTGPVEPAPPFLAVWLLIIVDNTFHLAINHLALTWF
jgi:hypothetical protein